MYNLPEITQSADKLKKLVRKEQDAQIQRRYHMLLLLKTGEAESRSGAARHLGGPSQHNCQLAQTLRRRRPRRAQRGRRARSRS